MSSYAILAGEFHEAMKSPFGLVQRGDFSDTAVDILPDITGKEIEGRAGMQIALAGKIRDSGYPGETFDQGLEMQLAENWLRATALECTAEVGGTPMCRVKPDALMGFLDLTPLYMRDPRDKGEIVQGFIKRLDRLPEYLNQQLERLDRPVRTWTKLEMSAGTDFNGFAEGVRRFAASFGYRDMDRLDDSVGTAKTAVNQYLKGLTGMKKRSELSIGHEATEKLFRYKGLTIPLARMKELAVEQIRTVNEGLAGMKSELAGKYGFNPGWSPIKIAGKLAGIYRTPKAEVVKRANDLLAQAKDFIYGNDLVKPIDNERVSIEWTPDYMKAEVPYAAMLPPGVFSKGRRETILYITRGEDVEKDFNRLALPPTITHELIPGHHYHSSRATEHPSKIRAWITPTDTDEGWATFVGEDLMLEMGFNSSKDLQLEEKYMLWSDLSRFGARVCYILALLTGDRNYVETDLGIEVKSPNLLGASVEFYRRATGYTVNRALAEVADFSRCGTDAAMYLLGNLMIKDMEGCASARQRNAYSRPDFLEAVLREGMMPLSYIRRSLEHQGIL